MFLHGQVGFGKENPGPPGIVRFRAGQVPRQQEGKQSLFVNPGEVERLQSEGGGLAAQAQRRSQAGATVPAQVLAQRGHIILSEPEGT